MIEQIYHEATTKPVTHSSEGGLPVEDRWYEAIERAFKEGYKEGYREGDSKGFDDGCTAWFNEDRP